MAFGFTMLVLYCLGVSGSNFESKLEVKSHFGHLAPLKVGL